MPSASIELRRMQIDLARQAMFSGFVTRILRCDQPLISNCMADGALLAE
jgi:hypothetical protein